MEEGLPQHPGYPINRATLARDHFLCFWLARLQAGRMTQPGCPGYPSIRNSLAESPGYPSTRAICCLLNTSARDNSPTRDDFHWFPDCCLKHGQIPQVATTWRILERNARWRLAVEKMRFRRRVNILKRGGHGQRIKWKRCYNLGENTSRNASSMVSISNDQVFSEKLFFVNTYSNRAIAILYCCAAFSKIRCRRSRAIIR